MLILLMSTVVWLVVCGTESDYIVFDHHSVVERESVVDDVNFVARSRRSLDEDATKKIKSNKYSLEEDQNFNLDMVWLGEKSQTQLILTTVETGLLSSIFNLKIPSMLYKSTNGGFTFEKLNDKIEKTDIRPRYGIAKSPINKNKCILVSATNNQFSFFGWSSKVRKKTVLIITTDGGVTFKTKEIPFVVRANTRLLFHPKREDWIIALEKMGGAWISKDFGLTWKAILNKVSASSVKWGAAKGKEGKEIYLSTYKQNFVLSLMNMGLSAPSLTVWKSSDGGKFFEEIVEHCYNFGVHGDFVYASINMTEKRHRKRIMHVSTDSGNTFHKVNIPGITPDMFYAVMDMYKGMIFLHVDDVGDTGQGTLYTSGANGLSYTKSLEGHFYTDSGFTDFFRVTSMEGVYITQKLYKDKTMGTVITFNRGVTWQPLYVDRNTYCKVKEGVCSLHLHVAYSIGKKGVPAQPPLYSENAPGIILAHGNGGDALTGVSNVWLSRNGGYNWTKIGDGAHHYAIGDNGNLIVVYPRINSTGTTLKYSVDQGLSWNAYQFTDTSNPLFVGGLRAEPHSRERAFTLWGREKRSSSSASHSELRDWIVITIDFTDMFAKKCTTDDMVQWYPHSLNKKGGCLLGEKTTFQRPAATSECYLGSDFQPVVSREKCTCTGDDVECDFGFDRQPDKSCKRNPSIPLQEVCRDGEEMLKQYSKGFRRTPGNVCIPPTIADDTIKYIDENKTCTDVTLEDYYGIVKKEKEHLKDHKDQIDKPGEESTNKDQINQTKKDAVKKKKTVPLLLAIVVFILLLAVAAWYYKRTYSAPKTHNVEADMSYIATSANHEEPADALAVGVDSDLTPRGASQEYHPRPKSERLFLDEETEDDEALLIPV